MNDQEKFEYLLSNLSEGSMTLFSKLTGIDLGTCSKIRNGIFQIGSSRAKKIVGAFPQVNFNWLMGSSEDPGTVASSEEVKNLTAELRKKDELIAVLTKQVSILQKIIEDKLA